MTEAVEYHTEDCKCWMEGNMFVLSRECGVNWINKSAVGESLRELNDRQWTP